MRYVALLADPPEVSLSVTDDIAHFAVHQPDLPRVLAEFAMGLLATVGAANRSYTDAAVTGGSSYSYTVTAVNVAGEGPASNQLSATAWSVPGAPTLTGARGLKGGVALTWTAPASNGGTPVTAYRIYRGSTSGGETLLATVGNVASYTDSTAPNGKTTYYQVAAVNAVGAGQRSNELAAKRTG